MNLPMKARGRTKHLVLAIVVVIATTSALQASTVVTKWENFNGHSYGILQDYMSWQDSEAAAVQLGGHLVTINDAAENAWVSEFGRGLHVQNSGSQNSRIAWIGLNFVGAVNWVSGEPLTYNRYVSGPNSGPYTFMNVADYVSAHSSGPFPGDWGSHAIHNFSPQ